MYRERKKNRLPGYRYSRSRAYYVTICVKGRHPVFGRVVNGAMILNQWGRIADACWRDLPAHYGNIRLGDHVVMPDHVHGVVWIIGGGRSGTPGTRPGQSALPAAPVRKRRLRALRCRPSPAARRSHPVLHRGSPRAGSGRTGM